VEFSLGGGRSLRRSAASRRDLNRSVSCCGPGRRWFEFLDVTGWAGIPKLDPPWLCGSRAPFPSGSLLERQVLRPGARHFGQPTRSEAHIRKAGPCRAIPTRTDPALAGTCFGGHDGNVLGCQARPPRRPL
jgi:hypothetical protein